MGIQLSIIYYTRFHILFIYYYVNLSVSSVCNLHTCIFLLQKETRHKLKEIMSLDTMNASEHKRAAPSMHSKKIMAHNWITLSPYLLLLVELTGRSDSPPGICVFFSLNHPRISHWFPSILQIPHISVAMCNSSLHRQNHTKHTSPFI